MNRRSVTTPRARRGRVLLAAIGAAVGLLLAGGSASAEDCDPIAALLDCSESVLPTLSPDLLPPPDVDDLLSPDPEPEASPESAENPDGEGQSDGSGGDGDGTSSGGEDQLGDGQTEQDAGGANGGANGGSNGGAGSGGSGSGDEVRPGRGGDAPVSLGGTVGLVVRRAADLAKPFAIPVSLAIVTALLMLGATRGPGRMRKVEESADEAIYRF